MGSCNQQFDFIGFVKNRKTFSDLFAESLSIRKSKNNIEIKDGEISPIDNLVNNITDKVKKDRGILIYDFKNLTTRLIDFNYNNMINEDLEIKQITKILNKLNKIDLSNYKIGDSSPELSDKLIDLVKDLESVNGELFTKLNEALNLGIANINLENYISNINSQLSKTKSELIDNIKSKDLDDDLYDIILEVSSKVQSILDKTLDSDFNMNPIINNVPLFDFNNISKHLFELNTFDNYIKYNINRNLFKSIFTSINNDSKYPYEKFITNDVQLNKNLAFFKCELWDEILSQFKKLNKGDNSVKLLNNMSLYIFDNDHDIIINSDLFKPYEENGEIKPSLYSQILQSIKTRIEIPGSDLAIGRDSSLAKAYLNSIILSNFDGFLLKHHKDKLIINNSAINSFGETTDGESKYKKVFKWGKKDNLDNSGPQSISDNSTALVEWLSYVIPNYDKKVLPNGKEKWFPTTDNSVIGKSRIDALATLFQSLPDSVKFDYVNNNETQMVTLYDLWEKYDNNQITFKQILELLLNSVNKNNEILGRESEIRSLYEFLYGSEGLDVVLSGWKQNNFNLFDNVSNPINALINHLRNVTKIVYRVSGTKDAKEFNRPSVSKDMITLDSSIKYDYQKLIFGLIRGWKTAKISKSILNEKINSWDDLYKFFTSLTYGIDLNIPESTWKKFIHNKEFTPEIKNKILSLGERKKIMILSNFGNEEKEFSFDDIYSDISGDSFTSILDLTNLFKLLHTDIRNNIVTTVTNFNKDKLPTMGVNNIMSSFYAVSQKSPNNFLSKNTGLYKRIETLSEVVSENKSKPVFKLSAGELFKLHFTRHFIESSITDDEMVIQPWNSSDKPSIYGHVINLNKILLETGKTLNEMSSDEISELMRLKQHEYYKSLVSDIYEDFIKLNSKLPNDLNDSYKKIEQIEKFFNEINSEIESQEKLGLKISAKDVLADKISNVFNEGGYVEFTEHLHYSIKNNKIVFNQYLKNMINIYSDSELYNKWKNVKEQEFISFLPEYLPIEEFIVSKDSDSDEDKVKKIKEKFNLSDDDFITIKDKKHLVLHNKSDKKTSEIIKKFLWTKNLFVSQYANMSVKDVFLHDSKSKYTNVNIIDSKSFDENINWLLSEESKMATVFTKRMNMPNASMTVYGKGKNGIESTMKAAVIYDPTAQFFNYEGTTKDQETVDGSARVNAFMGELMDASMPGYNIQSTQKPICESITNKASVSIKYASFTITNDEIRKSYNSKNNLLILMKKLNDFNLWSDNNPENIDLFSLKLANGNLVEISFTDLFPNYAIPVGLSYKKISKIKKNNSITGVGVNKTYSVIFEDGTKKDYIINTLFDLYTMLGGAESGELVDGVFTPNEYSVKLIGSLIKKHAEFTPTFKLKDKMIGMAVYKSAVKKGATNVNTLDSIFNSKNKLSYFNLDTSFFGIQLDAYHDAVDGQTKEITQLTSAITEMCSVPNLYNAVYTGISDIIEDGIKTFKGSIKNENKYLILADKFIKSLQQTNQINNATTILNGFHGDILESISFDNKALYKQFLQFIISKVNTDIVKRVFHGGSSALRPSYGSITLFEDKKGKKYFSENLIKKFDNLYNNGVKFTDESGKTQFKNTFKEGVDLYLSNNNINIEKLSIDELSKFKISQILKMDNFLPEPIFKYEIKPLDIISLSEDIMIDGVIVPKNTKLDLSEIDDYYNVKEQIDKLEFVEIYKHYDIPTDLKPEDVSFTQKMLITKKVLNEDNTYSIITKSEEVNRSIYDCDSLKFSRLLNKYGNNIEELWNNTQYQNFLKFIATINKELPQINTENQEVLYKIALKYAQLWTRRTFSAVSNNQMQISYEESEKTSKGLNPFFKIFETVNGTSDNFTYKYTGFYRNVSPIKDYKYKKQEAVHTNIYKNEFDLGDKELSDVSDSDFKVDPNITKVLKNVPSDVTLINSKGDKKINIVIAGKTYIEFNNNLYLKKDIKKFKQSELSDELLKLNKIKPLAKLNTNILTDRNDKGELVRISNFGEVMYILPKDYSIFVTNNNEEILYIREDVKNNNINQKNKEQQEQQEEGDEEEVKEKEVYLPNFAEFLKKYKKYDIVVTSDVNYNSTVNLLRDENEDKHLKFLNVIKNNAVSSDLSLFMYNKIKTYNNLRKESIDIYNNNININSSSEEISKVKFEILNNFKNKIKDDENLKLFCEKLSKQKWNSYTAYANNAIGARIPAQGMQSFNSLNFVGYMKGNANNIYVSHWQLVLQGSDYDIDKLYMMSFGFKNGIFEGWSPFFDMSKSKISRNLPLPNKIIYKNSKIAGTTKEIKIKDKSGNEIETKQIIYDDANFNFKTKDYNAVDLDQLLKNTNNQNLKFLEKRVFILNFLNDLHIKGINIKYLKSESESLINDINKHNKFYSSEGFKNYIVNSLIKISNNADTRISSSSPISFGDYESYREKENDYRLSLYNGYTMGLQQEQNAIGKDVIGIAATGLKNYFAMIRYYNEYYTNTEKLSTEDPAYFNLSYTINGKVYQINRIKGLNLTKEVMEKNNKFLESTLYSLIKFNNDVSEEEKLKAIQDVLNAQNKPEEDIALAISALLSLATDNAKELVLAKINAGVELAGMHIHLLMLGVPSHEINIFMTSEIGKKVQEDLKGDIFANKNPFAPTIVNGLSGSNEALMFKKIYNDSQELTTLGSLLKANQGSSALYEEMIGLTNNLKNMISYKRGVFVKQNIDLIPEEILKNMQSESEIALYLAKTINVHLSSEYCNKTNADAIKFGLDVNQLDLNKFFNNKEYQLAAINYYNLFKSCYNVLDILSKSKHFYSMFKAFAVSEEFLSNKSDKINFIEKLQITIPNIVSNYKITNFEILKKLFPLGNVQSAASINKDLIRPIEDFYDSLLINNFTKNLGYKINTKNLFKYLNLKTIKLLTDDQLKPDEIELNINDLENTNYEFIDLSSDYGIAQFKYIMVNYIIPDAKIKYKGNRFLKHYTDYGEKSSANYNLRKKNSFYRDESNFNDLEDLELGMKELILSDYFVPISDTSDAFKLVDLLTLYDLLENEGKFGGNRATNYFSKDLNNKESMSSKFLKFQNENKLSKEMIELLNGKFREKYNTESEDDYRYAKIDFDKKSENLINNFLMYLFGKLDGEEKILDLNDDTTTKISNYYNFIHDSLLVTQVKSLDKSVNLLTSLLKSNNIELTKECSN